MSDFCAICRNENTELCLDCMCQNQEQKCLLAKCDICSKSFHQHCYERWYKMRPTCPLCNTEIAPSSFSDPRYFQILGFLKKNKKITFQEVCRLIGETSEAKMVIDDLLSREFIQRGSNGEFEFLE